MLALIVYAKVVLIAVGIGFNVLFIISSHKQLTLPERSLVYVALLFVLPVYRNLVCFQ